MRNEKLAYKSGAWAGWPLGWLAIKVLNVFIIRAPNSKYFMVAMKSFLLLNLVSMLLIGILAVIKDQSLRHDDHHQHHHLAQAPPPQQAEEGS